VICSTLCRHSVVNFFINGFNIFILLRFYVFNIFPQRFTCSKLLPFCYSSRWISVTFQLLNWFLMLNCVCGSFSLVNLNARRLNLDSKRFNNSRLTLTISVAAGLGRHSMPPPASNPDLWPFDFEISMRVASKVWNLPSKFGHARPLGSWIIRYVVSTPRNWVYLFARLCGNGVGMETKSTVTGWGWGRHAR